jgi:hypothetical protein
MISEPTLQQTCIRHIPGHSGQGPVYKAAMEASALPNSYKWTLQQDADSPGCLVNEQVWHARVYRGVSALGRSL